MSKLLKVTREEIIEAFNDNVKKYTLSGLGKVLNKEEADDAIFHGRISDISFELKDGTEVSFFTTNHNYGWNCFPFKTTSHSLSFPLEVVPREELESGMITNLESYMAVFKTDKRVWSFDELIDVMVEDLNS